MNHQLEPREVLALMELDAVMLSPDAGVEPADKEAMPDRAWPTKKAD